MSEFVTIEISGNDVGLQYSPDSMEAVFLNEMHARELGLHALARKAASDRRKSGLHVPSALEAIIEACTYRDLLV